MSHHEPHVDEASRERALVLVCEHATRAALAVVSVLVILASSLGLVGPATAEGAALGAAPSAGVLERSAAPRGGLTIPRIGQVKVPIVAVGVRHGEMVVPTSAHVLGRWKGSAPFGAKTGSTLIVGHVSDPADRPGALHDAGLLRKGDRIVWSERGKTKVFKVTTRSYTPRTGELPKRIWRKGGPRVLHLVTCARRVTGAGGYFHYTHNLTITAKLVMAGRSS